MRKKKNKKWAKIALALGVVLMVVLLILALLDKPQAQRKRTFWSARPGWSWSGTI